jgi:hypothetical protein
MEMNEKRSEAPTDLAVSAGVARLACAQVGARVGGAGCAVPA